jgi:hypothetical protein
MNNRPTPETDAFSGKLEDWINFAEKLERERDEALHKLELCMAANSDVARIARERDDWAEKWAELSRSAVNDLVRLEREARHEIEGWRNKWDCAVTMGAKAEIERDEERKITEKLRKERFEARKLALAFHEDQTQLLMENAKLRDIAELLLVGELKSDDLRKIRAELDQLKEGGK